MLPADEDEKLYAVVAPWLWLFLNGMHSEYIRQVSIAQYVASKEKEFWLQRSKNELEGMCWNLNEELYLSFDRVAISQWRTRNKTKSFLSRLTPLSSGRAVEKDVPNRCKTHMPGLKNLFPVC